MPPNRNSPSRRSSAALQTPPRVMTWAKAMPVLVLATVFDLARMFFEMFWLFGPALAGVLCTVAATSVIGTSALATGASGLVCAGAATVVGVVGAVPIEIFGVIMSMVLGLVALLTLGLVVILFNPRLFKAQVTGFMWFMGSFVVSEIPLIGTIPSFTIVLIRLYSTQIKADKAALKKFNAEHAADQLRNKQRQAVEIAQIQANQQLAAANDAEYREIEAANDEEEIPE